MSLAAGALLLATFVVVEARSAHPLLPLRLFADRNRALGYVNFFLGPMAGAALFFFLTLYLQQVRGYGPLVAGFALLSGRRRRCGRRSPSDHAAGRQRTRSGDRGHSVRRRDSRHTTVSDRIDDGVMVTGITAAFTGSAVIAMITVAVALAFRPLDDRR